MKRKFLKKLMMVSSIVILAVLSILIFTIQIVNAEESSVDADPILQGVLEKYINYDISDEDKGTLVQYHLRTGINYKEESEVFPIKENETNIQMGQIDGQYPYDVKVVMNKTEATNGNMGSQYTDVTYNPETGMAIINIHNQDENGNMISDKIPANDARDDYVLICYYDTYVDNSEEREVSLNISSKTTLFTDENKEVYADGELKNTVAENIGELTSIKHDTEEIYNGYMKSNVINGTEYHTQYTDMIEVNVSKKEAHKKIQLTEENTFVRTNHEEIIEELGNDNQLVYRTTKFEKQNIVDVLGEEFNIEISDENGNILSTINNDTEVAEDGSFIITYENDVKNLNIKTSDIISEGILYIENTKEIKNTMKDIENVQVKTTTNIIGINEEVVAQTEENTEENAQETQMVETESYRNIDEQLVEIQSAQTKVDMTVSSTEWTNKQQNEVTFDIHLNATSLQYNLFKNPQLKIELPSQVEKVILGNSSIVYGNGLELQAPYIETDESGNFSIVANLVGEQTQYTEKDLDLITDVKISATIILKKNIENTTDKLKLVYTNHYTLEENTEEGNIETALSIKSYAEEQDPIEEMIENVNLSVPTTSQEVLDSLKLEVTPVKGDVTLNDGDVVYEGEYIKYNIKVSNTSNTAIQNVKVVGSIPDGLVYGELEADYYNYDGVYEYKFDTSLNEKSIDIGTIGAGNTYETFYEVQVQNLTNGEEQKEVLSQIRAYVGETEATNYEITNVIEPSEVKIFLGASLDNGDNRWNYKVKLTGNVGEEATVQIKLPEEFKVKWFFIPGTKELETIPNDNITVSEDNIVTAKLTVGAVEQYLFEGYLEEYAIDKNNNMGMKTIKATATASVNGKVYTSNENRIEYEYKNAMIVMTSPTEGQKVHYGEEIEYDIAVTNVGGGNSTSEDKRAIAVNLTDFLPEEVNPVSVTYETWEYDANILKKQEKTLDITNILEDQDGNRLPNVDIVCHIPSNETVNIKIIATAGYVFEDTKIENKATIIATETTNQAKEGEEGEINEHIILNKTSNTITHTILSEINTDPDKPEDPNEPTDPDDPENPDNPEDPGNPSDPSEKTYYISGLAWIDNNEDGARQSTEEVFSGITVMLLDMQNANTIIAQTETDRNGTYIFTNLKSGNYIVAVRYDTNNYKLTEYRKNGVSSNLNSDVSSQEMTIGGEKALVGATDILTVQNNIANVDIGLIENKVYDLSLNKSISKVTVQTNQKMSTYGYDNAKLAKIDIRAKEIEGAKVTVEYKIIVTNEGEVSANVGSVVDYLPDGFVLTENVAQNWMKQTDNTYMNASIGNQKIQPGQSITLTLTATKTMTADNTGIFINKAEIQEASSTSERTDIDSTPGNNIETEDDFSKAEIIISVGTGIGVYISIGTILAILVIIGMIIGIKKGKTNIKKFPRIAKLSIFVMLFVAMICVQGTKSMAITGTYVPSSTTFSFNGGTHGTSFSGGPFGWGSCMNIGTPNQDMDPPYYKTYTLQSETYEVISETVTSTGTISLSKGDSNVTMTKLDDNYYILGPFIINCDNSNGYTFEVKDRNGNVVSGVSTCNSNGTGITVVGNATFYLKIPASACDIGISLVKATNTATVSKTIKQTISIEAEYSPSVLTNTQWVSTSGTKEIEETSTTTATKQVEWKDFNGALEIIKQDADDANIKLSGVEVRVQNEATGYDKTFTTDENGKIHIDNLSVGTYKIIELSNNNYGYVEVEEGETTIYSGMVKEYILTNTKNTGNLRIEKKDADNDTKIQGVSFRLRKNISAEDQEALADFVDGKGDVNSNGYLEEEDLDMVLRYVTGKADLTAEQQNAADVNGDGQVNIVDMRLLLRKIQSSGYVVGMQKDTSGNLTAIETATGTVHFDDMTTTNNPEEATIFVTDEEGLAQIYNILIGRYEVEEISVGDNFGYDVDPNFISWEVTNSDGTTTTVDLSTSATIEVVRQKSTDTTESAAQQGTESTSNITDKNRRKYIKIRGFAWEERTDGKNSTKDYTWNDGTEDKKLANVTVRLIDKDGNLMDEAITDANGEYVFGNYDEDSNAIKLEIDKLVGAYIEFEYNGMSYQSIAVNPQFNPSTETTSNGNTITKYSGSRNTATDEALRNQFNNNYATIQGSEEKDTQEIKYNDTFNTNGEKTYSIRYNYDAENHESHVIYGDKVKYGYDGQKYPISYVDEQYTLQAVTQQSSTNALCTSLTPDTIRKDAVVEIGGLNLGVEERQMPDLFILQDMQDVQITFNDYTHTYHYAQRFEDPKNYIGENVVNEDNTLNVAVRFANKYIDNSYSREVYSADIVYNKQEGNEGKLKVFVTYKLQLTNESSSLFTNLKTLTNYYDARYENVIVRDEDGNIIESQVDDSYNQNGLKKVNIQANYQIPDGQTKELTITYQLNNDAINSILNEELTLDSITEVSSYSTYSDSDYSVPYAGIDVDSAPDTVEPEIVDGKVNITDTIEDDTDKAPSLILSVKEGRIIQGTVWEDSAIAEELEKTGFNKQRIGNGIYESTENVVNDVKVELMTVTESGDYEVAELHQWNPNTLEESTARAETTTRGQGTYEFSGVIPSHYVIRYTYGDNSVIVDPNGNTVKNVDIDNYKSTIYRGGNKEAAEAMTDYWYRGETSNVEGVQRLSDAKDTLGIMSDGRVIDNIVQNRNAEEDINYAEAVETGGLTEISADTRMFDVKLDYDINLDNFSTYADSVNGQLKFIFDNIDFGIIERPRQSLIVDKQVANIQIVLPNGNELINGDPRSQNLSGVKTLDDDVYIEIDNEIIQGATLRITYEISVDNSNCEIDYNNEDYYIYGTVPDGNAGWKIATVIDMFDYLPEDLVLQSTEGNNWERIDITSDMKDKLLADVIYDEVKGRQNIIHLANPIFENMVPGSEAVDTSMVVSKQLSPSSDDLTYENDIEIIKLKGRKTYDSIPGNYNPTTNESYDPYTDTYKGDELDDDEVEVTITPPTGESRAYWIYGIIGISVLIIMGVGVVIIKKKVLKN